MRLPAGKLSIRLPLLLWAVCLLFGVIVPRALAQSGASPFTTASDQSPIRVLGYDIDLTLDPAHHLMRARTTVNFTVLRPTAKASFQLNPALRVGSITDIEGNRLDGARISSRALNPVSGDGQLEVTASKPLAKGQNATWTFAYSGVFASADKRSALNAPSGTHFASIGDPVSYLLFAAEWFPIATGADINRFTASIHVHVPKGEQVFGSGPVGASHLDKAGGVVFDLEWSRPGFPGTIVAGKFRGPYSANGDSDVRVFEMDEPGQNASSDAVEGQQIATAAKRQFAKFTSKFGCLADGELNIVELPAGAVPAYTAPQLVAIAAPYLRGENSSRLLANTIAHQWWGEEIGPATRNDAWITNGMCRYAELEYLKSAASQAVFSDAIFNVSASALAYDTIPIADVARYADFSPQFQAMTYDKGAMIFRMLQWQIGAAEFQRVLRNVVARFAGQNISAAEFERIAETASGQNLRPFFTQWLDSTDAPALREKWTVYRLGDNKGYRTIGEIDEDLDLFQMPVEVRVDTDAGTIERRVAVAGPTSAFVFDTTEMPRTIALDPDRRLLRNGSDMQVRVHILRGRNLIAEDDTTAAIHEYRQALAIDRTSSLASYRLGEVYFRLRNYQAAADAFRAALDGDGDPAWTEVWSNLQLGKIFDASGERDRAVGQYRQALQTGDNTGGALDVAREYLRRPYTPPTDPAN